MNQFMNRRVVGLTPIELSLILVAVTLPFSMNINSYAIVLFSVLAFFSNSFKEKVDRLRENRTLWLLPIMYLAWMAFSYVWDHSGRLGTAFETNASLIVFPLIMGSMRPLGKDSIKKVMLAFVFANIAGCFVCLYGAYKVYLETHYIPFFFYHYLSRHINISAIYFSMYCVFSIFILLYYFVLNKAPKRWMSVLAITGMVFLGIMTLMLASKMFMLLLYLFALAFAVYSYFNLQKMKKEAIVAIVILLIIPIVLLQIPYVYSRITDSKIQEYRGAVDDQNGLAVRGVMWKSALDLIPKRPVLGYGHYTAQEMLKHEYAEAGFKEGVKNNFNSHNQYLYTCLCYGVIGLSLMLGFLTKFFLTFYRNRLFLGLVLVVFFSVANITECMLEVHKGIVFFFFFGSLCAFHLCTQTINETLTAKSNKLSLSSL